jgi:hypothetical protein
MIRTTLAATEFGTFIRQKLLRLEERPGFTPAVREVVAAGIRDARRPEVPLAPNVNDPTIVQSLRGVLASSVWPVPHWAAIGDPLKDLGLTLGGCPTFPVR